MPSTILSIWNPIVNKTEKNNLHFGLERVIKIYKGDQGRSLYMTFERSIEKGEKNTYVHM